MFCLEILSLSGVPFPLSLVTVLTIAIGIGIGVAGFFPGSMFIPESVIPLFIIVPIWYIRDDPCPKGSTYIIKVEPYIHRLRVLAVGHSFSYNTLLVYIPFQSTNMIILVVWACGVSSGYWYFYPLSSMGKYKEQSA